MIDVSLELLKGEPAKPSKIPDLEDDLDEDDGRRRIRCPRCGWEPGREDVWMCTCLHAWNTFETGGVCPACGRRWAETQCHCCHEWSPHEAWYERE